MTIIGLDGVEFLGQLLELHLSRMNALDVFAVLIPMFF